MPILEEDDYSPSLFYRNGHINSMYTFFFRNPEPPPYKRLIINTPDDDFFEVNTLFSGQERCLFLCHGLEGSTGSQYMLGLSKWASEAGWDVIGMNYRGCSGKPNKQLISYHSGFTRDLNHLVHHFKDKYESISIVGFSLGGNILLKYLGEDPNLLPNNLHKAVAISTPIDPSSASQQLKKFQNKPYARNFLKSLFGKIREKHKIYPDEIDLSYIPKIKEIWDYDEYYTSQIYGFKGAEDYYAKCNSKQFLRNIKIDTMIINALDDPFLPKSCFPFEEAKDNKHLHLLASKYGGHVGFYSKKTKPFWHEKKILSFLI